MMNKILYISLISFILMLGFINLASASTTVNVSTNKAKYYRFEMVYITVKVTSDGSPVEGVAVGIQVKDPDGFTIYVDQGTTDSSGKVTFNFRLSQYAKYGWYDVTATVTGGAGTTKFEVIPRPAPVGGKIGEVNKPELLAIFVMNNIINNIGIILLVTVLLVAVYIIVLKILHKKK